MKWSTATPPRNTWRRLVLARVRASVNHISTAESDPLSMWHLPHMNALTTPLARSKIRTPVSPPSAASSISHTLVSIDLKAVPSPRRVRASRANLWIQTAATRWRRMARMSPTLYVCDSVGSDHVRQEFTSRSAPRSVPIGMSGSIKTPSTMDAVFPAGRPRAHALAV
jgi:hypothetical protein